MTSAVLHHNEVKDGFCACVRGTCSLPKARARRQHMKLCWFEERTGRINTGAIEGWSVGLRVSANIKELETAVIAAVELIDNNKEEYRTECKTHKTVQEAKRWCKRRLQMWKKKHDSSLSSESSLQVSHTTNGCTTSALSRRTKG